MGNENAKIAEETGLVVQEVDRLYEKFNMLRHRNAADPKVHQLDEKLFVSKFPMSQQDLATLIFRAMDIDGNGEIDFREFCILVATLTHGSAREKIDILFQMYDTERRGYVTQKDVMTIVQVYKGTSTAILQSLGVEKAPVTQKAAASQIFASMNPNDEGHVSKEEFRDFCDKHVEVFEQLDQAFTAMKRAAYWDWDKAPGSDGGKTQSSSDCSLM